MPNHLTDGSAPDTTRRPIVVLLVDDQPFVAMAVTRLLAAESDIELHVCHRAADAVARANEARPTVILQDLVMPEIDGLTLVPLFRANVLTSGTPIIVLSGSDDAVTRARASAAGADDFLVKLPPRAVLAECIRRHALRSIEHVDAFSPVPAAPDPDAEPTLDLDVIAWFRQNGSEEFVSSLIDRYLAEAVTRVQTLADAAARRDHGVLTTTAHALRGSSSVVGARKLAALCARVENTPADLSGGGVPPAFMAEIVSEFVRVREALAGQGQRQ